MKTKITALLILSGSVMALGLNCIPNVGISFSGILGNLGLGSLTGLLG